MHRLSSNNPVRRRLFADESTDEARVDNFANELQEAFDTERIEKMKKWNFDFKNEVPLEGTYQWCRSDGPNDWIGIETTTTIADDDDMKEEDSFIKMQAENEVTPKGNKDEEMPLLRKRKQDVNQAGDKGVRRRISFDSE
ncbi:uncharacterized protein LOC113228838 [Hyposmocoma kahamanoa]|uniref:uncharacterized protein LOC113228838 n=1 Tax=Hyposmocoma kahamanoa TaxID=1477025 RepID=UPI000E6D7EC9|nr:uncharacterized protein LOC113228838 [Hyposmocoma kahamanoa]XP_026318034.1 uncharacterized protein LOC113228838 [Hyposmocoma kahamanoa]